MFTKIHTPRLQLFNGLNAIKWSGLLQGLYTRQRLHTSVTSYHLDDAVKNQFASLTSLLLL